MSGCTLADFDILIKGESAPYAITARYGSSTANGYFATGIFDPTWQKAYHILADSMTTPDAEAVMAIGSRLWGALIHGPVRDLWIAARADLEQRRVEGLRLRLDLQPSAVAALPWESLYDPERAVTFAAHPDYTLVRMATIYQHVLPWRPLEVSLPLRVLIVAPDDSKGTINSPREIAEVCQIMQGIGQTYVQFETMTGPITIAELRNKLAKVKPTIFHFIGHGEPAGLRLWQRGREVLVPPESLRAMMERPGSIKLAFINSCLAARTLGNQPFAGVAAKLLQAGIPAVIAMQYEIRDDAAIDFAHYLYEELISGYCPGVIDRAMSEARGGLYIANPGDFSFGTPVLWLNNTDGRIFFFDAPVVEADVDQETDTEKEKEGANHPPPVHRGPAFDLAAETEWLDFMVATTDVEHLPADFYILRSKWINLVDELHSLLHQLAALVGQLENPVYIEKVMEFRRYKESLWRIKRLIDDSKNA